MKKVNKNVNAGLDLRIRNISVLETAESVSARHVWLTSINYVNQSRPIGPIANTNKIHNLNVIFILKIAIMRFR
jgi:hypothetical protein